MSYHIIKKLNYKVETEEKKKIVDEIAQQIEQKMSFLNKKKEAKCPKYVFSIGGDGTMMHSMHEYIKHKSIIIGIHAGNVGFLTPFEQSDINSIVELIDNPKARIEQRSILTYESFSSMKHKKELCINEFAITAMGPNDMLDFSVEIEHRGLVSKAGNYKANAVLVSGPCGSTAYNMNAGGAIVDPSVKCMQFLMIAPTTLGARPIIIGKNSKIHVTVKRKAKVFSDGILIEELNPEDKISITLMPREANLLVPNDWNFYSVLSKKLMWNNGREV